MDEFSAISPDVKLGKNIKLAKFINLYGCEIGDESKIGAFVEIQKNAKVGRNRKISSHTFICEGVTILSKVTVGERAIVGAGSVVTKSAPDHAIVAGNPARVLRFTDEWEMTMRPRAGEVRGISAV